MGSPSQIVPDTVLEFSEPGSLRSDSPDSRRQRHGTPSDADTLKTALEMYQYDNSDDSYGSDTHLLYRGPKAAAMDASLSMPKDIDVTASSSDTYLSEDQLYPWLWVPPGKESDDGMHDPQSDTRLTHILSWRAFLNLGTMLLIILGLLMLFAGYPLLDHFVYSANREHRMEDLADNRQAMPPDTSNAHTFRWSTARPNLLIDPHTPESAHRIKSTFSGKLNTTLELVFSDEFEYEGRSFYPGDDPYWEAVDLHNWIANDFEWYSPEAITTRNGALEIRLERSENHLRNFRGGMLQSWNKLCFTGGLVVASIQLPGVAGMNGVRSAFWMMGNLGRVGHGASLQGVWPYSYDQCDEGTLINQTFSSQATMDYQVGHVAYDAKSALATSAFLPGQKLSACTCPDEDHPGPKLEDGSWKGRSAPEMDIMVARNQSRGMAVSQSCQMAPYNYLYNITGLDAELKHEINNTDAYRTFGKQTELDGNVTQHQPQLLSASSIVSQNTAQSNKNNATFSQCAYMMLTRLARVQARA